MNLFEHSVEVFTLDQTAIKTKMDREGWMFLSSIPMGPSENGYAFRMLFRRSARPNFVAFGEPGVAQPTFSNREDDDITPDPTNADGSCKHDYLCAYCNESLDGDSIPLKLLRLDYLEALLARIQAAGVTVADTPLALDIYNG